MKALLTASLGMALILCLIIPAWTIAILRHLPTALLDYLDRRRIRH